MKSKYLRLAAIFEYIFTFVYALVTALFYSVRENIYWLFLVLTFLSITLGLITESIKYRVDRNIDLGKRSKIAFIILTVLSVVNCPAIIFNLLAILDKRPSKTISSINEEYLEDENKKLEKKNAPKKWYQQPSVIVSIASFLTIVLSSVSGLLFETSGGQVTVSDHKITYADSEQYLKGQQLDKDLDKPTLDFYLTDPAVSISYTVYKPATATETSPKPVIIVVPGFTRTKATMTQYAIELSKRGSVVLTIDPGSQGGTTFGGYQYDDEGNKGEQNSYSVARSGVGYLITYMYNNVDMFNYIDRDQIGLVGHSAGGGDTVKLASDLALDLNGDGTATYEESYVKALYFSGYIKTSAANLFYKLRCNTVMSYPKYDEGSFRYQDENQAYEIIARRFINEVNDKTNGANGTYDTFIEDYEYGSFENGTYRAIHNKNINHCFEMYHPESIESITYFFRNAFNLETSLDDASQTWFGKELSNGIALVAAWTMIIALVSVIITYVPFMKSLAVAANERKANEQELINKYNKDPIIRHKAGVDRKNRGFLKRFLFWIPMIITAIIACLDYIPLARLSMDLFPDAAGNVYTYYFPARMMNAVFLWAVVNGAVGILIWVLTTCIENLYFYIVYKVKGGENRVDWSKFAGLKVKPLDLLKSLGLAVVLFFVFYGVLQLMYTLTHQDFRFMLISASPLNARFLMTWLIYLAGFYVFYFSNSLRVNLGIAREGFKEWQVLLIGALANSLGLVFIIIINYYSYFTTGTVFFGYYSPTDTNEMWLYINMVFGLIPMMAILPIFNRLVYKKTGNIYSPALLWCMIFIMMSLSASISFIPM